ncbi:hypothetical protein [Sphingomonas sp. 3-13AW]|uniref:hypothetical protein n=1 Tax=Sphingomonas sp. 3-13AW TaxID=3050450 RepID=UPI003BB54E81
MKITAEIDSGEIYLLRHQADFDQLAADLLPREEFSGTPERFPCLLYASGYVITRTARRDLLPAFFLYDFTIDEGVEELANYWQLETSGYFAQTDGAAA